MFVRGDAGADGIVARNSEEAEIGAGSEVGVHGMELVLNGTLASCRGAVDRRRWARQNTHDIVFVWRFNREEDGQGAAHTTQDQQHASATQSTTARTPLHYNKTT